MLNVIMLIVVVIGVYVQNIFQKQYTLKFGGIKNSNYVFNFIMVVAAFLFFALFAPFFFRIDGGTVLRAFLFAVGCGTCLVFNFLAIKHGSLAIAALALAFSLIIPTMYGVIFLSETLSPAGYVGLGALAASIVLINIYGRRKDGESSVKLSWKGIVFPILAFLGNGTCSTVQKVHQMTIGNVEAKVSMGYSVSFMFFAMLFQCVIFGIICLVCRPEKSEIKPLAKDGSVWAAATGVVNALVNILMLILAGRLDAVYMYPVVSAGGIALTFITALIVYKEKMKSWQYVGYVLGVAAVVLLSI